MVIAVTNGVKVSVQTQYQPFYSRPTNNEYAFSYRITIENQSEHTLQLLRRHWFIVDSHAVYREVEGEGVVGLQPVIEPGQSHTYVSGCNLDTPMGKMYGTFLMERVLDGHYFEVEIPAFSLVYPPLLN